jgi:hypothetical protein
MVPMKRISNYTLLVLQWVVMVWGLLMVLTTLHLYAIEVRVLADLPDARPGADSYSPPILHRMVGGLCTGFATMGIGGIMVYLRRLYLAR